MVMDTKTPPRLLLGQARVQEHMTGSTVQSGVTQEAPFGIHLQSRVCMEIGHLTVSSHLMES